MEGPDSPCVSGGVPVVTGVDTLAMGSGCPCCAIEGPCRGAVVGARPILIGALGSPSNALISWFILLFKFGETLNLLGSIVGPVTLPTPAGLGNPLLGSSDS